MTVPSIRIRSLNHTPVRFDGSFVLYWMNSARRPLWNFALDRAVEWASALAKPLLVVESLELNDPWASARFHTFVAQGMVDNSIHFGRTRTRYMPYIESEPGAAGELLAGLASEAALVIADDHPSRKHRSFLSFASGTDAHVEAVDSCGLLPLGAADREFESAQSFRRFLQRELPKHLLELPSDDATQTAQLPYLERIPGRNGAPLPVLAGVDIARLAINYQVRPVRYRGGMDAGDAALTGFFDEGLEGYATHRNDPEHRSGSELSPYLRYGHVSAHEVFFRLAQQYDWEPNSLSNLPCTGSGWWGMNSDAEAFLDHLVTWRELGFNTCQFRQDYGLYESLPEWARDSLEAHVSDEREWTYSIDDFEDACTHDAEWNAAQLQLVTEGRMHGAARIMWGKKILEWTPSPREALHIMVELNNKYAVDGGGPLSYAGIFWVLGRYDSPRPERQVFGKVRYIGPAPSNRRTTTWRYPATTYAAEQGLQP